MDKYELLRRTRQFAIRVFRLVERLPQSPATNVVVYQWLKAASSVAANYRAVHRAKAGRDLRNTWKVVLEEAGESNFRLTFTGDIALLEVEDPELEFLVKESG